MGRKNWLFADSDSGGEHVTVLYSLIGTCRLNNVELGKWLRYVIKHILKSRSNRAININTVHMSRLRISEPFFSAFCVPFLSYFFSRASRK
uniref:Transposase n=1 Tax=Salmonella enterica subsp. salamae TaxID=59202 RepID=I3W431_SALER|nr:Transposase [Salmonella enterica subsp. salamae]